MAFARSFDRLTVLGRVKAEPSLRDGAPALRAYAALTRPARGEPPRWRRWQWGQASAGWWRVLRIYEDMLVLVREVRPVVAELERRDADLARQFRRALHSGPLNIAEGAHSAGGNRRLRYHTALGSMREALACLEVGEAAGYIGPIDAGIQARFHKVIGTLVVVLR